MFRSALRSALGPSSSEKRSSESEEEEAEVRLDVEANREEEKGLEWECGR